MSESTTRNDGNLSKRTPSGDKPFDPVMSRYVQPGSTSSSGRYAALTINDIVSWQTVRNVQQRVVTRERGRDRQPRGG